MKVGLFGGSFNPIHNSHVKIIDEVLNSGLVDEVWIIPCGNHVFGKGLIGSEQRIDMIKLAIGGRVYVKINRMEVDSGKMSYAIDTVDELMKEFPEHEFCFISGSDISGEFVKWYRAKELSGKIEFILYERGGYEILENSLMRVKGILKFQVDNVSSSEIRERIKKNIDVNELLPRNVLEYIRGRGLYQ